MAILVEILDILLKNAILYLLYAYTICIRKYSLSNTMNVILYDYVILD